MRKFLALVPLLFCGCSSTQEAAVQSAISTNAAQITSYCNSDVLPIAADPLITLAASASSDVKLAQASSVAACAAVPTVAQSASTLAWLAGNVTTMKSKGKVLAPVVKPVPIAGTGPATAG